MSDEPLFFHLRMKVSAHQGHLYALKCTRIAFYSTIFLLSYPPVPNVTCKYLS